ncbi:MAG: reverse transcriptase domain-containing protein [Patescibacteria group bacterium]
MSRNTRYPQIGIRSKYELAKRISDDYLPYQKALDLINDSLLNFDEYWRDSKKSNIKEQKYVRTAIGTPLGELLRRIDKLVLVPHDQKIPEFIFGGLSGRNHIQAAKSLLGKKRQRFLLGFDIARFFEQINESRVSYFFHKKCNCTLEASQLLAKLCCVPTGPKGSGETYKTLARGFATSSRLAVWCNLDIFFRINWKVKQQLHKYDPKVMIFVDDIGITASCDDAKRMSATEKIVIGILSHFDVHQPLPINPKKTKRKSFSDGAQILGLGLGKNLSIGSKSRSRIDKTRLALKAASPLEKRKLLQKRRGQMTYKRQISQSV